MGCKLTLDIKGGENTRTVVPTDRSRKKTRSTSPMSDTSRSDMSTSPIFMLSDGSSLYELSSSSSDSSDSSDTAPDDSSKEGSNDDT